MQFVANTIISLGASALLGVGVYQGMNDRTASSTSLLGFGFLLIVLLVLAKFKRFKGFGFEAEMWEEKQIEAAALVDRLSLLSEAVAQQVALIASKLGLWDAGLSFPQMADLLDQTQRLLDAAEVLPDRRDVILAPLYQRIELNYWHAARGLISKALRERLDAVHRSMPPGSSRDPANAEIVSLIGLIEHDQGLFDGISYEQFKADHSLIEVVTLAAHAESLKEEVALRAELHEIDLDFNHFMKHHTFRRDVDLSRLLQ